MRHTAQPAYLHDKAGIGVRDVAFLLHLAVCAGVVLSVLPHHVRNGHGGGTAHALLAMDEHVSVFLPCRLDEVDHVIEQARNVLLATVQQPQTPVLEFTGMVNFANDRGAVQDVCDAVLLESVSGGDGSATRAYLLQQVVVCRHSLAPQIEELPDVRAYLVLWRGSISTHRVRWTHVDFEAAPKIELC